eukprot:TRINITY_DN800_c0_g2_i2.p2 TRINITY_DN800_c0_g2~~TRINITY_DN800_c0_g2_i2.p2  ORF type:complete len:151 (-),score=14.09 TRINITY_DN800_c0_g2_i2:33-485(-)
MSGEARMDVSSPAGMSVDTPVDPDASSDAMLAAISLMRKAAERGGSGSGSGTVADAAVVVGDIDFLVREACGAWSEYLALMPPVERVSGGLRGDPSPHGCVYAVGTRRPVVVARGGRAYVATGGGVTPLGKYFSRILPGESAKYESRGWH